MLGAMGLKNFQRDGFGGFFSFFIGVCPPRL
jgi:hypothetical protein